MLARRVEGGVNSIETDSAFTSVRFKLCFMFQFVGRIKLGEISGALQDAFEVDLSWGPVFWPTGFIQPRSSLRLT